MDNITILIVEDEKSNLEIISNHLNDKYNIKVASNGEQGLKAYKKVKPQIIIADLNMPKLNGIDMIKQIREKDQNVKVIVLTAHSDIEYLLKATELKLTKYLVKPIDKNALLEAIELAQNEINSYYVVSNNILSLKDNYSWDIKNCELKNDTKIIKLTPKEKKILGYLFTDTNTVKSYENILVNVWDDFYETPTKEALKTLMTGVRRKLPKGIIENVFGIGYKVDL